MDLADTFNPSRLTLARKRRGLTKVGLALATDLAPRTITQYERGAQKPRSDTILRLSEALAYPIEFFSRDDPDGPNIEDVSFRAKSRMSARIRDQVLGFGAIAIELSEWISSRFVTPSPDVPQLCDLTPSLAAATLRREWGLGESPLPHTIDLVESHGVRVFSLPHELQSVDANSFWHDLQPFILLTRNKTSERSRFDIAHELGHLTMHRAPSTQGKAAEHQADDFASALLMPEADVRARVPQPLTLQTLITAKQRWGVSLSALVRRLYTLDILTDWQYRDLFITISRLGYRKNEPQPLPFETSQTLEKVRLVCSQRNLSLQSIARDLAIPANDLSAMMFDFQIIVGSRGANPAHRSPTKSGIRVLK